MAVDIEDLNSAASDGYSRVMPLAVVRGKAKQTAAIVDGRLPGTSSIWLKTFGCSHNMSDAEYMHGQLEEYGYRWAKPLYSSHARLD